MERFAQILLPLPLNATFTYRIPPELEDRVKIGYRVIVPFGKKRFYTGIVESLVPKAPEGFEVKDIALSASAADANLRLNFRYYVTEGRKNSHRHTHSQKTPGRESLRFLCPAGIGQ